MTTGIPYLMLPRTLFSLNFDKIVVTKVSVDVVWTRINVVYPGSWWSLQLPGSWIFYEDRSEINASYFIRLVHDVRGGCW